MTNKRHLGNNIKMRGKFQLKKKPLVLESDSEDELEGSMSIEM